MLVLAGWSLTACDEDHSDFPEPVVYPQGEVINMADITGFVATPTAAASSNINLGTMTEDSIQLFTLQMGTLPQGMTFDSLRFEAWPADKGENLATKAKVAENGMIAKEDLAKLVYTFYGKKVTERVFKAKLLGNAFKGKEAFLIELGDFTLRITPEELENPYYYIYGNVLLKSTAEEAYKAVMTPDANSDVVYTYTSKFVSSGDIRVWNSKYWQEGYKKKDFTKLYGSGEEKPTSYKGTEGKLEQGRNASIFSPTKEYYTFTIDLEKLTYEWVKLENQEPTAYDVISLIGIGGDWNTDVDMAAADKAKHNWFAQVTIAANTELKFRANHDWATNWGFGSNAGEWTVDDDVWSKPCTTDASNIVVPAGTYYVYFCDITGAAHFVPTSGE
jgi:hypothetical protein